MSTNIKFLKSSSSKKNLPKEQYLHLENQIVFLCRDPSMDVILEMSRRELRNTNEILWKKIFTIHTFPSTKTNPLVIQNEMKLNWMLFLYVSLHIAWTHFVLRICTKIYIKTIRYLVEEGNGIVAWIVVISIVMKVWVICNNTIIRLSG